MQLGNPDIAKLFYRLMQQAVSTTAPGIKELYNM